VHYPALLTIIQPIAPTGHSCANPLTAMAPSSLSQTVRRLVVDLFQIVLDTNAIEPITQRTEHGNRIKTPLAGRRSRITTVAQVSKTRLTRAPTFPVIDPTGLLVRPVPRGFRLERPTPERSLNLDSLSR
jgi:hypothetical protein